jgi:hypothetical protein
VFKKPLKPFRVITSPLATGTPAKTFIPRPAAKQTNKALLETMKRKAIELESSVAQAVLEIERELEPARLPYIVSDDEADFVSIARAKRLPDGKVVADLPEIHTEYFNRSLCVTTRSSESDLDDAPINVGASKTKKVPGWMGRVDAYWQRQRHLEAEDIFGQVKTTIDIEDVFGETKKRYRYRTSSAHWNDPPIKS